KLAPLLIPPFRGLLMNELADFFPGAPALIANHATRRLRDLAIGIRNRMVEINRGLWLLLFAWIAQWSSPISRRAFRARHGNRPLEVQGPGGNACPTDEPLALRYSGRRWDRVEFSKRIRASNARFVLLQQDGSRDELDDLVPLFDDPWTFA